MQGNQLAVMDFPSITQSDILQVLRCHTSRWIGFLQLGYERLIAIISNMY